MEKYIIIGATGLIGRKLTEKLVEEGKKVLALGRNKDKLVSIFSNDIDTLSYDDFYNTSEDYTDYIVINLAYARKSDFESIKSSIDFTYEISKKIKELKVKKYVYISSQSVYDERRKSKASEDDMYYPANLYGLGKVYLENWLEKYFNESTTKLIVLRLGSLVGQGFEKRITARMTQNAIDNSTIKVNENGQVFSFVDIDDIVEQIISVSSLKDNKYMIYNLGSSETYSLTEIANVIKSQLADRNMDVDIQISKEGAYKNNSIDITKFLEETGYKVKYDLKKIIEREIDRSLRYE